jgi:hypothetical protein
VAVASASASGVLTETASEAIEERGGFGGGRGDAELVGSELVLSSSSSSSRTAGSGIEGEPSRTEVEEGEAPSTERERREEK